MRYLILTSVLAPVIAPSVLAAEPVVLEQVVSRHDPTFDVARARLAVGRDGNIYLGNPHSKGGYVLRITPDGRSRLGGTVGYSFTAVAANKEGVLGTAEAHFAHRTAFWGRDFASLGAVADFLVSDTVQWNAPSDVAAGTGSDFYAIDQHRLRILKLAPPDKLVAAISLERTGEKSRGGSVGIRVDEPNQRFVTAWPDGVIWCVGFDGKPLWKLSTRPVGEPAGGFDLDQEGSLYVLTSGPEVVSVYDRAGKKTREIKLGPRNTRSTHPIHDLRVLGDELIVKRSDPTTLFEAYKRKTGAFARHVAADVEVVRATYPAPVWTAGKPVPVEFTFDAGSRPVRPNFRFFLRPLGVPEWTELPQKEGAVVPPVESRGLYHVRITPDVGGRVAEYTLDGLVEIRAPDAVGTVSILTPLNRFYYGRGEAIPVTLLVRAKAGANLPKTANVSLKRDGRVVQSQRIDFVGGKGAFTIPAKQSEALKPGRYVLDAEVPGFSVAPQYLEVGPGLLTRPRFHIVQHGDYSLGFPSGPRPLGGGFPGIFDMAEATQDHLSRCRTLNQNLFVDRLGHPSGLGELLATATSPPLVERLKSDPMAVAPEKALFEGPIRRTISGYGAVGIEEQSILLYMDAGLPIGTLFDRRKPEQMDADLRRASEMLRPYPAYRGWSWAANWWLEKHGADAAKDAEEKKAYETALKAAKEKGTWSPVLETVSERTFAHAVEAEKRFRAVLDSVTPGKISAMTSPYRAIQTHPPIIFGNADEVDLHYQAEQTQPPQVTPHQVDFYKRPGKPAWGHPELWNDDGTGGMISPTLLQMAMRGADGVGQSGPIGPWSRTDPTQSDPRSGAAGTTSAYRAVYELLHRAGPWLSTSENADRVAIAVSTRMQRIETWDGKIGGAYFDSLFEAYNACLYAHRPASFVFVEDLKPETLKKFAAILIVNQRVELDPPLAAALSQARKDGVQVFHDETCRPELVKGFTPLGVAFNRIVKDPSAWQDDAAYSRFPEYFKAHARVLRTVLGPKVPPVAECDNPEVLLTERKSGSLRLIWVVNNTMLGWSPGLAWRASLLLSHRVPVIEKLKLDVPPGAAVYDVWTGKEVAHTDGVVTCDLRTVPARLYAILSGARPDISRWPTADLFGPHVRDMAVSPDGKTAILNTFNWDHNLYGIDLASGETSWRNRIGHTFAFDPSAHPSGFAVQGFDVSTGEGYHLYALGRGGKVEKRFALFGLPKRATSWASAAQLQDAGINSFAVAPDGSWVASAGDLGVVVWDRSGKELWSDAWWETTRKRVRLLALDDQTLVTLDGTTASARNTHTGAALWTLKLADTGNLRGGVVSSDRKTLVVHADTLGGRLFVIRGGKLTNTIVAAADEVAVSPDGSWIVATDGRQLKVIDPAGGLLWTFTGNDTLRHPRIAPDAKRIAAGSELGFLMVLDRSGIVVAEQDLGALPIASWLPNGDLVAATWMGKVVRFDPAMKVVWERKLAPSEADARSKLLAKDRTPTVRKSGWGNATDARLPLTSNLLAETKARISAVHDPKAHGDPLPWQHKQELLTDGKPEAPPGPWLGWNEIGFIDSGWKNKLAIEVDTFRVQLRLTGITFVEDPDHPESWLRDLRLQWWDAATESWRNGPLLLSDAAVHSHTLETPIEAARFRLVSTGGGTWPIGNLRLGELVFHGEILGSSHPDAVARKAVAVLFDEKEADLTSLKSPGRPFGFRYTGAYSGGKCLELSAAGETGPAWQPPFGHAIPNWDFEIAENPKPGQYRYLRFAWKTTSPQTTGMGLLLGRAWPGGGIAVVVGDAKWKEGVLAEHRVAGRPPQEWEEVTIDLWAASKGKPPRIQALSLRANGGGALFDHIVLARTESDLPKGK